MVRLPPRTMILAVLVGGAVTGLAATQLLAHDRTVAANPATTNSRAIAPATTLRPTAAPTTDEPRTPTERGHEALELITYDWRDKLSDWSIVFAPGREGVLGLTYVDDKTIEVFVRDDQTAALLAHVIAHEMGHAVDVTLNSSDERERWQEARDIGSAPWWPDDGATDFLTGAGDFAESFAAWQVGSGDFRSKLAGPPNAAQLGLLAELCVG
ncbi:MAG: hypothetical protein O3C27_11275 [Actinomycetota bacterium]|nr:hypothetical protein [Actinomycetota bacterium]